MVRQWWGMCSVIALTLVPEEDQRAVQGGSVEMEPLEEGCGLALVAIVCYLIWCRVTKVQHSGVSILHMLGLH